METVINGVVEVVSQYPQGAIAVAAVPVVQVIAAGLAGLLGWLGKARGRGPALPTLKKYAEKVAAFPIRLPAGKP